MACHFLLVQFVRGFSFESSPLLFHQHHVEHLAPKWRREWSPELLEDEAQIHAVLSSWYSSLVS